MLDRHHCILAAALAPCLVAAASHADDIFVDSGQLIDIEQSFSLTLDVGDIDADGDLDVFIGTYVSPALLYLNDGHGAFTVSGQVLPSVLAGRVIMADFDGDADLDVFVLSHSFQSHILFNDGTGVLTQGEQVLGSMNTRGAAAGDIDADGDIDLFISGIHPHAMKPLFNDGRGVFTFGEQAFDHQARAIELADLDGDGDLDAFCAFGNNAGGPMINRVLLNNGHGVFTDSGQLLGDRFSTDVRLADLDADGDFDAVVANALFYESDGANTIWLNDGSGVFSDSGQRLGDSATNGIDIADIDGDGDIDFMAANSQAPDAVWLNDGAANFTLAQLIGPDFPQGAGVALGDFDADNDPDAFVVNSDNNGDRVLINTGHCRADANNDGVLNVLDFIAFQNAWASSDPCADCNEDGLFNVLDFLCFQNLFQAGCKN